MGLEERETTADPLLAVDTSAVVNWYDRHFVSPTNRISKQVFLDNLLREALQLKKISALSNEKRSWLIGSKQTFSEWRKRSNQAVRRKSVLLALLQVSGIDFSLDGFLSKEPIDFTKLIKIGKLKSQIISNQKNENDQHLVRFQLSSVSFLRAWEEVTSSWFPQSIGQDVAIGQVNYALREAILHFEHWNSDDASYKPVDGWSVPEVVNSEDLTILWDEKNARQIVQPYSLSRNLQTTVIDVCIGQIFCKNKGKFRALLSICEDQISYEFVLSDLWKDRYRRVDSIMDKKSRERIGKDLNHAKQTLIALVIGQRKKNKIASLAETNLDAVET